MRDRRYVAIFEMHWSHGDNILDVYRLHYMTNLFEFGIKGLCLN